MKSYEVVDARAGGGVWGVGRGRPASVGLPRGRRRAAGCSRLTTGDGAHPQQDRRRLPGQHRCAPVLGRARDHAGGWQNIYVRVVDAEPHEGGDGGALLVGRAYAGAPLHRGVRLRAPLLRRHAHQHQQRRDPRQLQPCHLRQRPRHHHALQRSIHSVHPAGAAGLGHRAVRGHMGRRRRLRAQLQRVYGTRADGQAAGDAARDVERELPADVGDQHDRDHHAVHQQRRRHERVRRRLRRPARHQPQRGPYADRHSVFRRGRRLQLRLPGRAHARHLLHHLDQQQALSTNSNQPLSQLF